MQMEQSGMSDNGKKTVLPFDGQETIKQLWSTPIGISKPFSQDFIEGLKDDVRKYVVAREIKRKDKTFYKSPNI